MNKTLLESDFRKQSVFIADSLVKWNAESLQIRAGAIRLARPFVCLIDHGA